MELTENKSNNYSHYSDQELWLHVQDGDENAFVAFFGRRSPGIYVVANKIIKDELFAEDILQEVFIRAWRHRQVLATMENPVMWLLKVATNLSITYLKSRHTEKVRKENLKNLLSGEDLFADSERRLLDKEVASLINNAIELLPLQRKKIYQLSREEGLSRKEIAVQLGISEHTVKNQLTAALKSIQVYLTEHGISYVVFYFLFLPLLSKLSH